MSWIGVDLDRTLAYYTGGGHLSQIGEPIPKMLAFVKNLLDSGVEVRIFTARVSKARNLDGTPYDTSETVTLIQNWTEKHLGKRLAVTNEKTFDCDRIYDDIAVQVIPNTGEFVG